jgi:hypothetical protein
VHSVKEAHLLEKLKFRSSTRLLSSPVPLEPPNSSSLASKLCLSLCQMTENFTRQGQDLRLIHAV